MPNWEGSDRRQRLPSNWASLRLEVLERDGWRCTWYEHGQRCPERATDVDHRKRGDDHSKKNLRSLCSRHHRPKSGREGAAALAAKRAEIHQKFRRREEPHPGTL